MRAEDFNSALLTWYDRYGRKNLPWQQDVSAYRVWVSEIMLQQTQVNTVIPYFERFMARFPDIAQLANASEDSVLHLWTGLGYYARARNLHKTARLIHTQHDDLFPANVDQLIKLPGIGRSTAGAIASIAMGIRAPILDGNVRRVLCRFHAVSGWPGKAGVQKTLWKYAEEYTPRRRVKDYTQAIMDLGATVCTRARPQCPDCPLNQQCKAYQTGSTGRFPESKPKSTLPMRSAHFLVLKNDSGEILLEKRPPNGIWGGLWSLPQHEDSNQLISNMETITGCKLTRHKTGRQMKHTFSHFRLDIHPLYAQINNPENRVMEPGRWRWYNSKQADEIGLAAPIKVLLENSG